MTKTSNATGKTKTAKAKPAKAARSGKTGSRSIADKLSDLQLVALSAGCQREDRTIAIPEALEDEAIAAFAASLIDLGLAKEAPAGRGQPVWRQDDSSGQPITLRITNQALTVLGIDEEDAESGTSDPEVGGPTGKPLAARNGGRDETAPPTGTAGARMVATAVPVPDDALAQPGRAGPPQPRAGSKQSQLIAMLSRDDGVSITEIATALGWLPHTTRAALTGLRHKGYELAREISSDRGSLYRITAMPITAPAATDAVQAEAA